MLVAIAALVALAARVHHAADADAVADGTLKRHSGGAAATQGAEAAAERDRMLAALRERGLVGDDPSEREVVEALHAWIRATPAVLLGVSLADAVGERRAQNQPGTDQEYPNWKVPLADGTGRLVLLDDLFTHARAESLARVMRR